MGPSWSSVQLLLQLLGQMLVLVSRVSSWNDPIEHNHTDKSVHLGYLLEDFSRAGAINNTTTRTSQSTLGIYWRISAERERSTSLSKTLTTTDSFATIISGKVERVRGNHTCMFRLNFGLKPVFGFKLRFETLVLTKDKVTQCLLRPA